MIEQNVKLSDKAIRKCGNDFKYCDGNCADCEVNNFSYTTSTDTDKEVEI